MHILISDLKRWTMDFSQISNSFIFVALFHYMDSCGCFWVERGPIDRAAFWNGMDCKYLGNSSVYNNGCRCHFTQKQTYYQLKTGHTLTVRENQKLLL